MDYYRLTAYASFITALLVLTGMALHWLNNCLDLEADDTPSGRHAA